MSTRSDVSLTITLAYLLIAVSLITTNAMHVEPISASQQVSTLNIVVAPRPDHHGPEHSTRPTVLGPNIMKEDPCILVDDPLKYRRPNSLRYRSTKPASPHFTSRPLHTSPEVKDVASFSIAISSLLVFDIRGMKHRTIAFLCKQAHLAKVKTSSRRPTPSRSI